MVLFIIIYRLANLNVTRQCILKKENSSYCIAYTHTVPAQERLLLDSTQLVAVWVEELYAIGSKYISKMMYIYSLFHYFFFRAISKSRTPKAYH